MPTAKQLSKKKMENRTDADWQAINDARQLANAVVIRGDAARLKLALQWAGALAIEEEEESAAMKQIAGEANA